MKNSLIYLKLFLIPLLVSCNIIATLTNEETEVSDRFYDNKNEDSLSNACGIHSGCTHWFDGQDQTTLFTDSSCTTQVTSAGDNVRCWENKGSLSADDITRAAGNVPSYETNAVNNLPGIFSDNGSSEATFFNTKTASNYESIIIVFRANAVGGGYIFGNAAAGPTNETSLKFNGSGHTIATYGGNTITDSTANYFGSDVIVSIRIGSGGFTLFVNGNHVGDSASGTISTSFPYAIGALYYGAVANGAPVYISEMVIYDFPVGDSEIQKVNSFLKQKWGI